MNECTSRLSVRNGIQVPENPRPGQSVHIFAYYEKGLALLHTSLSPFS